MSAKTLYCNCILTSLNFDFLLVPSSNLLHLLITIITLIFENTKLFKLHYILQNFCVSLSPPSYVIEVQSEADWIQIGSSSLVSIHHAIDHFAVFSGTNFTAPGT